MLATQNTSAFVFDFNVLNKISSTPTQLLIFRELSESQPFPSSHHHQHQPSAPVYYKARKSLKKLHKARR